MADTPTCPYCGCKLRPGYKNGKGTIIDPPVGQLPNVHCCDDCWYEEPISPSGEKESSQSATP